MKNLKEDMTPKPTMDKPISVQSKGFEKNFTKTMNQNQVDLNEVDSMLSENEYSLKKKIFSLGKMESLVFSDPKLSAVYDEMSVNGEERYGYHYNETIMNMLFNDYVLNSPKYLQKYKMAIPKEKKRRDKSGINQLKKDAEEKQTKSVDEITGAGSSGAFAPPMGYERMVDETTGAASSGAYSGPAAWGGGDLMKGGKSDAMRKPIWQGGAMIKECNYLVDASGFEKYVNTLNEQTAEEYIIDKTSAFNSGSVKGWNKSDTNLEIDTLNTGKMDEPNLQSMEEEFNRRLAEESELSELSREDKINAIIKMSQNITNPANKLGVSRDLLNSVDDTVLNRIYFKFKKGDNSIINLNEKAKSKSQQHFMGMVRAVQKGELNPSEVGDKVENAASTMSKRSVEDFASTKTKNLPNKVDNIKNNGITEDATSMANASKMQSREDSMTNKMETTIPTGTQSTGGLQESVDDMRLLEELNNELNAFSLHHEKLVKMNEDKKIPSEVVRERIVSRNPANFKSDLQHSGTKEIIDVEKELQWKDQQTDVPNDPQKLGNDIEKKMIDVTKGNALTNVGNSDNKKGNEIPKRNLTTDEQNEVNMYRLGQQDLVYDNKPDQRFEDRMKADMGDELYKQRQDKLEFRSKAPMYNKDTQPVDDGMKKNQFNKEKSGFNNTNGLNESVVTGRYNDALNKRHMVDFKLDEVSIVESVENLYPLDFTGLGNTYMSKTVNNKVVVNEGVVNVLTLYKFFTDGKNIFAEKNKPQSLVENENKTKNRENSDEYNKIKHLLGYNSNDFVNTKNVKKNRGF